MIDAPTPEQAKNSFRQGIKDNLLLGLLVMAPTAITLIVLLKAAAFLDQAIYQFLPGIGEPKELFGVYIPGLGLAVTFFLLLFAGFFAKTIAGKFLRGVFDTLFSRVPLVRGLYSVSKQISSAVLSNDSKSSFKHVVVVPFPSPSSRTLGFVTGEYSENESIVFVPTAPNPTSGYVLIYRKDQIEESSLGVDAALQLVVSCGALVKK